MTPRIPTPLSTPLPPLPEFPAAPQNLPKAPQLPLPVRIGLSMIDAFTSAAQPRGLKAPPLFAPQSTQASAPQSLKAPPLLAPESAQSLKAPPLYGPSQPTSFFGKLMQALAGLMLGLMRMLLGSSAEPGMSPPTPFAPTNPGLPFPGDGGDGFDTPVTPPITTPEQPVPTDDASKKLALEQLKPEMFPTYDNDQAFSPTAQQYANTEAPYIDQKHPAGASADYDGKSNCGPAAVAMVAKSFGLDGGQSDADMINDLHKVGGTLEPEQLKTLAPTDPHRVLDVSGSMNKGIVEMAHHKGLKTHGMPAKDHSDKEMKDFLKDESKKGGKFVVLGNYSKEPGHEGSNITGHYITVDKVNDDGTVHVEDPLDPNLKSMTQDQLLDFTKAAADGTLIAMAP